MRVTILHEHQDAHQSPIADQGTPLVAVASTPSLIRSVTDGAAWQQGRHHGTVLPLNDIHIAVHRLLRIVGVYIGRGDVRAPTGNGADGTHLGTLVGQKDGLEEALRGRHWRGHCHQSQIVLVRVVIGLLVVHDTGHIGHVVVNTFHGAICVTADNTEIAGLQVVYGPGILFDINSGKMQVA